jgi:hypothetical protein
MMIALAASVAGCWAAAAGAGAAAGIYYSERGAESRVTASYDQVVMAARRAMSEMGAPVKDTDDPGGVAGVMDDKDTQEIKLEGTRTDGEGDVEVIVTKDEDEAVKVEVVAKKSPVTWDKEFAGKVLERIVQYSGNGANQMNQD